jgi:TMEM175 potassium channel family protein
MVIGVTGDRPGVFERGTSEFDRALSFIDAIFGFSVTLLVTTLDVPPAEAWKSLGSLLDSGLGDQLLAFVISFAVVSGFWRGNHRLIATFNALDPPSLRFSIYLVALVVFIPFTTRAISDPNPAGLPLPTALYAANVAAVVLVSIGLTILARWRGLTDNADEPLLEQIAGALLIAVVFLGSIPMAYRFGPGSAKWCWLTLVVLGPLLVLVLKLRHRAARRHRG